MKVLVTGGAGFIGKHLVRQLLQRGYEVTVIDSLEQPTHNTYTAPILPKNVTFIHGNVLDHDRLEEALNGVQVVYYLAATGGYTDSVARYTEQNSLAISVLFETLKRRSISLHKFIVASSIAVYGEGKYLGSNGIPFYAAPRGIQNLRNHDFAVRDHSGASAEPMPTDEMAPIEPNTIYGVSKYDQERITRIFCQREGIPWVALRFFLTYGPEQSLTNPYTGVVSIFCNAISNNRPPVIYEDGLQSRDFVFVDDVVRALITALENDNAQNEVYNVGTGIGTSVIRVAELISDVLGATVPIKANGIGRPGDVRHMIADTSKITSIGYTPQVTVEEGIRRFVDWYRSRNEINT